jgi:hypothetical protein
MHIAPVWPSTVKESNRQIRSTDPAAMHGSMAAMSGAWLRESCAPFPKDRSASPDHRVGHASRATSKPTLIGARRSSREVSGVALVERRGRITYRFPRTLRFKRSRFDGC